MKEIFYILFTLLFTHCISAQFIPVPLSVVSKYKYMVNIDSPFCMSDQIIPVRSIHKTRYYSTVVYKGKCGDITEDGTVFLGIKSYPLYLGMGTILSPINFSVTKFKYRGLAHPFSFIHNFNPLVLKDGWLIIKREP